MTGLGKLREASIAVTTIAAVNIAGTAVSMQTFDTIGAYLADTTTPIKGSKWTEGEEVFGSRKFVAAQRHDSSPFACVLNPRVTLQAAPEGWSSVEGLIGAADDGVCPVGSYVMPGQVDWGFMDRLADERTYWDTALRRVEGFAKAPTFSFPKSTHSFTGADMVTKVGDAALSRDDSLVIGDVYNGKYGSNGHQYGPGQCLLGEGDAGKPEVRDYGKVPYGAGFLSVGVVINNSNLGDFSCAKGSLIVGSTRKE